MFIPSFNTDDSKEYEVTENFVLLESVQDAFAPATHKGNIGSKGSKLHANHCQNIKTALRSVVEEKKILPLVEEVLAKVYSKLQGKAVRDYEVKVVRLI